MIRFGKVGLELSVAVARALLANTVEQREKPHLSVGIDEGDVCATDGKTLVRFQRAEFDPDGLGVEARNGRYWAREYVVRQLAAAGRNGPVLLAWETMWPGFPPAHKVEPTDGAESLRQEIGLDVTLLGRLELVAKACRRERAPGEKVTEPVPVPGAVLTSIMGALDPMRFTIGEQSSGCVHVAHFTIMPMRIGYGPAVPGRASAPKAKVPRAKKAKAAA